MIEYQHKNETERCEKMTETDLMGKENKNPYVTMAAVAEAINLENLTPEIDLEKVKVIHRNVNRPQFFLAGIEEYFDRERIQILGGAEEDYLKNKTHEERLEKFNRLCKAGIPAVVIARGITVFPELLDTARKYGMPVLFTKQSTSGVMVDMVRWINERLAPRVTLYGVFVDVFGEGILVTGSSGIGKSETAIELIKRGHRLVADDLVEVSKVGDSLLMGQAPELTRHFAELRGIGIVDVKSLYGVVSVRDKAPIDMIINLEEWDKHSNYDRLGLNEEYANILGVKIVRHTIPISTGRNLAIIIETAAVNNRQKKMGYNAAQEMCDRVSNNIQTK